MLPTHFHAVANKVTNSELRFSLYIMKELQYELQEQSKNSKSNTEHICGELPELSETDAEKSTGASLLSAAESTMLDLN